MRHLLGLAACLVGTAAWAQSPSSVALHGDLQADTRSVWGEADVSTSVVRRARIQVEGTADERFRFRLLSDFGSGRVEIQDAFVDALVVPGVTVRVGKFKGPVGLELLRSPTDLDFPELALASQLVPNREVGALLRLTPGRQSVEVAITNGVVDGASGDVDADAAKDVTARVLLQPVRSGILGGLAVGVAATAGAQRGSEETSLLPTFQTSGRQAFFRYRAGDDPAFADGARTRVVPQLFWTAGPAGLLAEAVGVRQRVRIGEETVALDHRAWEVTGTVVLTGEDATYGRLRPRRPFAPEAGRWGAVAVAAGVHRLAVDPDTFPRFVAPDASERAATAVALGVNWSLTDAVRLQLSGERTTFTAADGADAREAEALAVGRIQLVF